MVNEKVQSLPFHRRQKEPGGAGALPVVTVWGVNSLWEPHRQYRRCYRTMNLICYFSEKRSDPDGKSIPLSLLAALSPVCQ